MRLAGVVRQHRRAPEPWSRKRSASRDSQASVPPMDRDVLAKIEVEGGTAAQQSIFYTALYRAHVMPHDLARRELRKSDSPLRRLLHLVGYVSHASPAFHLHRTGPPGRDGVVLLDTYAHTDGCPMRALPEPTASIVADQTRQWSWTMVKHLPGINRDRLCRGQEGCGSRCSCRAGLEIEGRQLEDWKRSRLLCRSPINDRQRARWNTRRTITRRDHRASAWQRRRRAGIHRHPAQLEKSLGPEAALHLHPRYATALPGGLDCDHLYPDDLLLWWDTPFYEGSSTQYSTYTPQNFYALIDLLGEARSRHSLARPDVRSETLHARQRTRPARPTRTFTPAGRTVPLSASDNPGRRIPHWPRWPARQRRRRHHVVLVRLECDRPISLAGQPITSSAVPSLPALHLPGCEDAQCPRDWSAGALYKYVQSAELDGKLLHRAWLTHMRECCCRWGTPSLHMGEHPAHWDTDLPPDELTRKLVGNSPAALNSRGAACQNKGGMS